MVHDRANDRLHLDIDISERRGVSSSGKTVTIANGLYQIAEKTKLSFHIYDKKMNKEESIEADEVIEERLREKERAKKLKLLKD